MPTGPDGIEAQVIDSSGSSEGPGIARAFTNYVNGINTGDYEVAYGVLSPAAQCRTTYQTFVQGTQSSYIVSLDVSSIGEADDGRTTAEVIFASVQDPEAGGTGQGCSDWQVTYVMVQQEDEGWLIDASRPHAGSPAPC